MPGMTVTNIITGDADKTSPQPTEPINAEYAMSIEATKIIVTPVEGKEVFAEQNKS